MKDTNNTTMFPHSLVNAATGIKLAGITLLSFTVGRAISTITALGEYTGLVAALAGALTGISAQLASFVLTIRRERIARQDQQVLQLQTREQELHARQIAFYQGQVKYHHRLEIIARNRSHKAVTEIQRCIMHILELERAFETGTDRPEPFKIKLADELFGPEEIPLEPIDPNEGLQKSIDAG